jgi:hypothetical protein
MRFCNIFLIHLTISCRNILYIFQWRGRLKVGVGRCWGYRYQECGKGGGGRGQDYGRGLVFINVSFYGARTYSNTRRGVLRYEIAQYKLI